MAKTVVKTEETTIPLSDDCVLTVIYEDGEDTLRILLRDASNEFVKAYINDPYALRDIIETLTQYLDIEGVLRDREHTE